MLMILGDAARSLAYYYCSPIANILQRLQFTSRS